MVRHWLLWPRRPRCVVPRPAALDGRRNRNRRARATAFSNRSGPALCELRTINFSALGQVAILIQNLDRSIFSLAARSSIAVKVR